MTQAPSGDYRFPSRISALCTKSRRSVVAEDQRKTEKGTHAYKLRLIGYGIPDEERACSNTNYRTTFISSDEASIRPKDEEDEGEAVHGEGLRWTVQEKSDAGFRCSKMGSNASAS